MDTSNGSSLHVFIFPFLSHSHIIPLVDIAKLFAAKGVKATLVTTPLNVPSICRAISSSSSNNIHIQTIKFPADSGLPQGCDENAASFSQQDMSTVFLKATRLLQHPFEQLLMQHRPDCLVADLSFPWTVASADKFGIPTALFTVPGFMPMSAARCMGIHQPHKNASSDSELFVIPRLPGEIKLTRLQVPDYGGGDDSKPPTEVTKMMREFVEAEAKSLGVILNTFYELEKAYVDFYRDEIGKKVWHVGPVSLCNKDAEQRARRGKESSIDEHECLKWLDTKKPNSVVYVCFRSLAEFSDAQLRDMALGLEASGQPFIWVVRKGKKEEETEEWLPEGLEKRMEGKGLIIRGWAPQVMILEHEAVGAFVTHCGWNSILETVGAGVPMVTWPISGEQFYNEKLLTDILKIGVPVGSKKWGYNVAADSIKWEAVEKAVKRAMVGDEAEEMRNRMKVLSETALRAVEAGGSSDTSLNDFIQYLTSLRAHAAAV